MDLEDNTINITCGKREGKNRDSTSFSPELFLDIVEHTDPSTLSWVPLVFRQPWNVAFGNLSKQNITVAGDALQPMTPDLGQDGCSALEDAVVLGRHIGTSFIQNGHLIPGEMASVLTGYVEERRWRTAWLITGSLLSWWMEEGNLAWNMKFFKDVVYKRFLHHRIVSVMHFDCTRLDSRESKKME